MMRCGVLICEVRNGEIICWDEDERVELRSDNMRIHLSGVLDISEENNRLRISTENLRVGVDEDGAIKIVGGEE